MLGDLYTLPIGGGQAALLKGGVAFDTQPRWSPSGKFITYTSDQSGCDNIWVLEFASKKTWPVTNEPYHFLSNPFWTTESSIVAVKWYTSERSLGGGEIWSYSVGGYESNTAAEFSNAGNRIIGRVGFGAQVGPEEPVAGSADGKSLLYSKNTADSTVFNYNKDPHAGIYSIFKYDISSGSTTTISSGPGGAARPILNRARNAVAFIRRTKYQTSLMIQDLKTGTERVRFSNQPSPLRS
jgi:Tol biopolymer transport system component